MEKFGLPSQNNWIFLDALCHCFRYTAKNVISAVVSQRRHPGVL